MEDMAEKIYLNDDWSFGKKDEKARETVRLPHTVAITPFHYFDESIYQGVFSYERTIDAKKEWMGKTVLLTFEGSGHDTTVSLNGKVLGAHHCGYTAFSFDLTDELQYGEKNELSVTVDSRESLNVPPFGFVIDYMTYGGLYREVYLEVKEKAHIDDVFVFGRMNLNGPSAQAEVSIYSTVEVSADVKEGTIICSMAPFDHPEEKKELFTKVIKPEKKSLKNKTKAHVKLWDVEAPNRYILTYELLADGTIKDTKEVVTGFRDAQFRKDGFFLNGRRLKIRGLNRHQAYPYIGYAAPERLQRMDAKILKNELGVNAARTSHYPQSHYFVDECDKIGLMVFTEMPGWQHIGDAAWKDQAVKNTADMVKQYRNHPSIILWGVRINESPDDDEFYRRTNETAHALDPSRPTGGVRNIKKSHLYEDVYTYNDFVHDGKKHGVDHKSQVTSDMNKPYLVSEYNGHMYPTKSFDWEEKRAEHAMRHVRVLDAVAAEDDICGSFGWCMFDYNTHKDFGSGDRICYHGVMDMFRNAKLAAAPYETARKEPFLEISSAMDIGEHPGCNRGETYIFTNADSVKMYKNNRFIKEYIAEDTPYKNMIHGPLVIDDYIGDALDAEEDLSEDTRRILKDAFNTVARTGVSNIPPSVIMSAFRCVAFRGLKASRGIDLYTKYIGDWGGESTVYKFEAYKDGKRIKTIVKEPMHSLHLLAEADHTDLCEGNTYDMAMIRLRMLDENGNTLSFCNDPVSIAVSGDLELIGPKVVSLQGGMYGALVKTTGKAGQGSVTVSAEGAEPVEVAFTIAKNEEGRR